jgi:hypothetical protein
MQSLRLNEVQGQDRNSSCVIPVVLEDCKIPIKLEDLTSSEIIIQENVLLNKIIYTLYNCKPPVLINLIFVFHRSHAFLFEMRRLKTLLLPEVQ